uniref:M3 family metallopeptidase n=1 Tax=Phascolarctobacterium succinatutens TaxID=626940 RepID=UPI0026EA0A9C
EYVATLHKGLTEGWIDVYENKGKRSGAYSWGVYGVHPFVLLNYQQRYNSISTLAHEMGHALHSFFSSQAQTYINSDYTIFCAEVASTTNENLLLEYTLQHATDEQKIYLLNQYLEAVRTTVYRQVQFAEFEKYIHGEITAGRSLQAEKLENYWLQSNKDYYGPALTVDKELASEWSRIPHFYTPFYVYKYATGYSAATAFASAILGGQPGAVEKYLGFLHAGGSDYSLNILKNAGVDLNTPQPVTVTLQRFAEKLQELKALLGR